MKYLAHISEDGMREQTVLDHLKGTAVLAESFADVFGMGKTARRCGMAHDIGKYSERFQKRIRGSAVKVDHATAGGLILSQKYKDYPAAFCVFGHHAGLPDGGNNSDMPEDGTFCAKMKRLPGQDGGIESFDAYSDEVSLSEIHEMTATAHYKNRISAFFATRMLYSSLVDADFLDTEHFMSDGKIERGGYASLAELEQKLSQYMETLKGDDTLLNRKRSEIRQILINGAKQDSGLFSLTVPTGGGKTLASMSFALRHALNSGMTRIIYVIPYCSIIEQTQCVFSKVFGEENVVAHYANVEYQTSDDEDEKDKRYLAIENWGDAPIILTTAVQFFESLYGNKSSVCRKLHNIGKSMLIYDEAQMLPVPYMKPCISAISLLVKEYGCSAVLCTATQPSLDRLFKEYIPDMPIRELYPGKPDDDIFRRVTYKYDGKLTDEELAERLTEKQVLCIVNNRRQAQKLFDLLPQEGSFYLTTTMYPKHRRMVLDEIRQRLKDGEPCRVISTSLIEAGVDVDFPIVYRALAGIDSICQSAGRCNREGKRRADQSIVHIFDSQERSPDILRQNIAASRRVLDHYGDDIACPAAIKSYFDFLLYTLKSDSELDQKNILERIQKEFMPFESVARDFHLIDSPTRTVYVLNRDVEGQKLAHQLAQGVSNKNLWRHLGQYAVSVYPQQWKDLLRNGALQILSPDTAILLQNDRYQDKTGLSLQPAENNLLEL